MLQKTVIDTDDLFGEIVTVTRCAAGEGGKRLGTCYRRLIVITAIKARKQTSVPTADCTGCKHQRAAFGH